MIVVCSGAAIKLRLVEQACGCSTVRGGGRHIVLTRVCNPEMWSAPEPPCSTD